jgi:hypothetical protein
MIINDTHHNNDLPCAECSYTECHILFTIVLSVVMLNVVMLGIVVPDRTLISSASKAAVSTRRSIVLSLQPFPSVKVPLIGTRTGNPE